MARLHTLPAALAALALGAAAPALADDSIDTNAPAVAEPGAPASVTLDLQIMAASKEKQPLDAKLAAVAKRLGNLPFGGFKLLAEQSVKLDLKTQGRVELPAGRVLELKPTKFEKSGKLRVILKLLGKDSSRLVVADTAIEPGGDILVGGPKIDEGNLLVYIRHSRTTMVP